MPCTVQWQDEMTLLIQCMNLLCMDKVDEMLHTIETAISEKPGMVQIIIDWRKAQGDPLGRHDIIKRVVKLTHSHPSKVAAVDIDRIVSFWIDIMNQEKEHLYIACFSIDEAIRWLSLIDAQSGH